MIEKWIILKGGKRMRAKELICEKCSNSFLVRKNLEDRKYCSRKCYYSDNKRVVVEVDCSYCKKQIQKSPKELKNSKSGLYFCNIKCKSNAQKIGGIREIMPQHYGTTLYIDYRSLFSPEELICIRCGYDEFESCVHIHHFFITE